MKITIWLKGDKTTMYVGGDIENGKAPVITAELKDPQIQIEPDKYLVVIKETK